MSTFPAPPLPPSLPPALAPLEPSLMMALAAGLALVLVLAALLLGLSLAARLGQSRRREPLYQAALGADSGVLVLSRRGRPLLMTPGFPALLAAAPGSASGSGAITGARAALRALEQLQARQPQLVPLAEAARSQGLGGSLELALGVAEGQPPRWLTLTVEPLIRPAGAILWRISDTTAQRLALDQSRRERTKLRDFFDHLPVGLFSVDQDGRFVLANATLAGWLGTTAQELVEGAYRLGDILVDPPRGQEPFDLLPGGGAEQRGEVIMIGLQGRRFPASVVQQVVRGETEGSVLTRTLVRDLTPERDWQEELWLSEQRFQRLFEDSPVGIALVDTAAELIECNPAFVALVGQPREQLIGQPLARLLPADQRLGILDRLAEVRRGGRSSPPIEVRFKGPRELVAQLYARRLAPAGAGAGANGGRGPGPGMILHLIDATEQKNLEVQVIQSQKMQAVGQLAGGIAHDFNNLLTAMLGFCDLLLLRHKPGDQSFADIMQIKQNAARAANLVRQLLAFSRQQTLQPRVLDLTDVIDELTNLLRRLIGENIELQVLHGRDLGLVRVDLGQFEQALINLAVNARDAMANGGRLTITTSNLSLDEAMQRGHEEIPPGDYVLIEVTDTGTGIAPEILPRIFEPFFSTKEIGSGTGLGLSTVYGIVRQTGGFVFAESLPGAGASFVIVLPRYQGRLEPSVGVVPAGLPPLEGPTRPTADLTGSESILLVEDEDAVRVFSARALRNKGYRVVEAKSGEAALVCFQEQPQGFDLLITDVVMPQMDGIELLRQVRSRYPELKVIFISGYAEDRFRDQMGSDALVSFLPKPFSLKQLAGKVRAVLNQDE